MNPTSPFRRIDTDVHIRWQRAEALLPFLSKSWHDRWMHGAGHTQAGLRIQSKYYNPLEAAGHQGCEAVADLITEWVEPHRLDAVILSVYDAPALSTFGDIDYPIEVARAVNEWISGQWLDADTRFHGSITVATQDPQAAASEIRRASLHPRMVQVMLPSGTRFPYGHRHYDPIYEAAEACGLAVAIHAGTEGIGTSNPPSPCGWPGKLAEMRIARSTTFLAHLTSLITEGVFTRFPELRIIGLETGVAWLAPYLWRFDKNYKGLRSECPWLKELPSDYVRRFFRFGTQGVEFGPPAEFWRLLASVGAEELLMFSSNYPRWDHEPPDASPVLSTGPAAVLEGIWSGTARDTYPRLRQRHGGG